MTSDGLCAHISSSKRRRLRNSVVKRNLWMQREGFNILYNTAAYANAQTSYLESSWWQPEAELPCEKDVMRHGPHIFKFNDDLTNQVMGHPVAIHSEPSSGKPLVSIEDIHAVASELDALRQELCDQLYSRTPRDYGYEYDYDIDGAYFEVECQAVSSVTSYASVDDHSCEAFLENWRGDHDHILSNADPIVISPEEITSEMAPVEKDQLCNSNPVCIWVNIEKVKQCVIVPDSVNLCHIERALAKRLDIQHHQLVIGSLIYNDSCNCDPELSVTAKEAAEKKFKIEFEKLNMDPHELEDLEMEVQWLGHLFTYERGRFWRAAPDMTVELRRGLTCVGLRYPPVAQADESLMTRCDFEDAYFSHEPASWDWQERYADQSEDADLIKLLQYLRSVVGIPDDR